MSRDGDGEVDESKRATLRRFAAIGAASPFVGLASASESSSDRPDAIVGYLASTPGAHFSKLRDDLQLGTGEAQHHLRRLEREGTVESRKDGDYRRYFPADRFSAFEQVTLGYLRRETARGMLIALLRDPSATAADIAAGVGVSRSTVSKYAAELAEVGLLERAEGYVVQHPETVLVLVVRYAESFDDAAADLAAEADALVEYVPDE